MASCPPSLLLSLGSASGRSPQVIPRCLAVHCSSFDLQTRSTRAKECVAITRRDILGFAFGAPSLFISSFPAKGAGLPPEEKPRLCDDTCEKELENVPMITTESGLQYKDIKVGKGSTPPVGFQVLKSSDLYSSLEKGQPYIFRVGSGQVIKGLDEGILGMKIGGKRRLYIPGSLAFPKGLTSAPGRPRVAPNSPVIFDVSLEYIPGLELDEE
ncbi:hypothetical protein QN277_007907 [Acacia crassicarpa]|uniref:peptidylprolyl isomerase n=1 Tax=Acacia crassicarpa TaxID=499986 RepID=A0AAE1MCK5_9FABA|nr:hypothetical protein QN277_007907 [Acacia crassicarpa]